MKTLSTRQAARKLGVDPTSLSRYIAAGKIPAPETVEVGDVRLHAWTEEEIEQVRQLLPKIANGRKTRYQKQKSEVRSQNAVKAKSKAKQPQAKKPVSNKKK